MDVTDAHAEGQRELCMPNLATNSASNGGKLASNCIALAFNKHPIASNALATNTKSASNGGKSAFSIAIGAYSEGKEAQAWSVGQ